MDRKPQGVVSYAGLDETALLAGARLMFAGDGSGEGGRFASLMPLFPAELILSMPFAGVAQQGAPVAPGGFSIDPAEYHCRLQKQLPRLYTGDNLTRNRDGDGAFHGRGVVTVDEAWTTSFPQYQPYAGERLCIYPLGGGAQCAAVPESLYPKAAGLLRSAETALGITHRCHDYAHYVYRRIRAGEAFDADVFETEYLALRQLTPVFLTQKDLGRMMQDTSMLQTMRTGSEAGGLYTEDAKRAEHIRQYVPGLYASDVFEDLPITRRSARLLQPVWEDGFVSDWWICAQDAAVYAAQDRQTLDMAALCQGFQLAPVYDPLTRGGRYADRVRVVTLRDKDLRLRTADTLNNPAYGSGMSPLGSINKLVYLPGSRELLRQGKLAEEESHYLCVNTTAGPEKYRQMTAAALLQEKKGRLVDALYRRESVLSEVQELSPEYEPLHRMMNQPVEKLENALTDAGGSALSGYDADLDYLRRMGMEREWKPLPNKRKTFRFAPDALRQSSIESGFAMRGACLRCTWQQLAQDAAEAVPAPAEAADAVLPAADTAQPPAEPAAPLWWNAADPCWLTTDAGGLYPTDEELAQGNALPVPGSPAPAAQPAHQSPAPEAKPEKTKKKGKKKSKKQKPVSGQPFTEEELLERQVPMQLPEPLPGEVGMGRAQPVEAAADQGGEQPGGGVTAAQGVPAPQQTDGVPAAEMQRESTAEHAAEAAPEAPTAPQQEPAAGQTGEQPGGEAAAALQPTAVPSQPPRPDGDQPDPSLEQLKNGQLSFRFDTLS